MNALQEKKPLTDLVVKKKVSMGILVFKMFGLPNKVAMYHKYLSPYSKMGA